MILLKHVGLAVQSIRRDRRLEVDDLSAQSGISDQVIAGLEDGTSDIQLHDLLAIAKVLGVTAIDLVDMTRAPS